MFQTHPEGMVIRGMPGDRVATHLEKVRERVGWYEECLGGRNARQAERVFGWGRGTVKKGLRERATGIVCHDHYAGRGNRKTEEKCPQLEAAIRALVDPVSQADPKFQTPFAYTRITAQAVRQTLLEGKGYLEPELPCEKTLGNILNRLGYRLKRIQKIKPRKNCRRPTRFSTILTG